MHAASRPVARPASSTTGAVLVLMNAVPLVLLMLCGSSGCIVTASSTPEFQPWQRPQRSYGHARRDPLVTAVNDAALGAQGAAAPTRPGGPYGLAQRPSMGWRSWNAYHNDVTQAKIEAVMDAMVAVQPGGGSILELGFSSVGLDDAWQACGQGFNGTFHAADGTPLWNNATFPDPAGMVAKAHSLQLTAGWYLNNCHCHEPQQSAEFTDRIYRASVKMLADQQWDGVKLDSCASWKNTTYWASLLEATGRPVTVENCHNTHTPTVVPDPLWGHDGQCPYNWFRSSGDIDPGWRNGLPCPWDSVMANLASTVAYQNLTHPLSKPGCWSYPDMLEVGNMASAEEDRAHFGSWCIVSSPLILGHDMTNASVAAKVWPIISNKEAIAVNQQWAGHPGRLVATWNLPPSPDSPLYAVGAVCNGSAPTQRSFEYNSVLKTVEYRPEEGSGAPRCLKLGQLGGAFMDSDARPIASADLRLVPCEASAPATANWQFTLTTTGQLQAGWNKTLCVDLYCDPCHSMAPLQLSPCHAGGGNQQFTFAKGSMAAKNGQCIAAAAEMPRPPPGRDSVRSDNFSLWAKPQPGGAQAVFLLSNQVLSKSVPTVVEISFAQIFEASDGVGAGSMGVANVTRIHVRDIWAQRDLGLFDAGSSFATEPIAGHGSHFFLFTPQTEM